MNAGNSSSRRGGASWGRPKSAFSLRRGDPPSVRIADPHPRARSLEGQRELLLPLPQRCLGAHALGDLDADPGRPERPAGRVVGRFAIGADPPFGTPGQDDPVLIHDRGPFRDRRDDLRLRRLPVVGMDRRKPELDRWFCRGVEAEEVVELGGPGERAVRRRDPVPEAGAGGALCVCQPLEGRPERLFGLPPRGDLVGDHEHLVAEDRQERDGPPSRARRPGGLDLARERLAGPDCAQRPLDERRDPGGLPPELPPGPADQGLAGFAESGGEAFVRPDEPLVPVPERDVVRHGPEDPVEKPLLTVEAGDGPDELARPAAGVPPAVPAAPPRRSRPRRGGPRESTCPARSRGPRSRRHRSGWERRWRGYAGSGRPLP